MKHPFLRVVLFVVAVVAIFIYIGEALTDISGTGAGGAVEGEISEAAGEALFLGKGKCYTCHSFGSEGSAVRCPNLGILGGEFAAPVGVRAAERRAGDGLSAIEYLVESIYNPDVYLVEGYPRDLMKPIHRPPIALSDDQITSVVLYLLAKSEVEITDDTISEIRAAQQPFVSGAVEVAEGAAEFEFPEGDAEEGRYTYEEMRCFQCHEVAGIEFEEAEEDEEGIGPDLTSIGSIQTLTYLAESILDPNRVIVADPPGQEPGGEGSYRSESGDSRMPEFHDTMTLRQLLDVIAFLKSLEGEESNAELHGE